jgi:TPR repeat protein
MTRLPFMAKSLRIAGLAAACLLLQIPGPFADPAAGLAACESRDWVRAARELQPEEETTLDIAVVRCLADMFFAGLSLPRDPGRGFMMWKRLADRGNDEAQDMVGYLLMEGEGTERDARAAEAYFLRSAGQGNETAMSELALYYSLGMLGCCRDPEKALYWTRRLAELGDRHGEIELMEAYARGAGVARDSEEAVKWAERAARQDSVEAYLFLGAASRQGLGTEKNLAEAYKWFDLAAGHGEAAEARQARRGLDEIAPALTPAQLRQAKRLALEWRIRYRSSW